MTIGRSSVPGAPLDAAAVRERAARVASHARALRTLGPERVAEALAGAATALDDRAAVGALSLSSGLTEPMVRWALETAVAPATAPALLDLVRARAASRVHPVSPARLAVYVLSGNVLTAPFAPVCHALLAGVPCIAKASSRDDAFAALLAQALERADPQVAGAYDALTFPGGTRALEDALFAQADVVAAFGHDHTLTDLRARLPSTTTFVPHGHGVGAAWIQASALRAESEASAVARALALDVAAYDQRGCLSPHGAFVETGSAVPARRFAELLVEALAALARTLPRGALPVADGAAQLQWRGVATVRGTLLEGDGYAVALEGDAPMRLSPGYRNVSVLEVPDVNALGRRLVPLGVHLKCLGVAGDRRAAAAALPPPLAPRVCALGTMQTPPLGSLADGVDPWHGLERWVQLD